MKSRLAVLALLAFLVAIPAPAGAAWVHASAPSCDHLIAPLATPVGISACSGVRPGAFFTSPVGGCTFNFLFKGSDGYRYIGTAGHCLLADSGQSRWPLGKGPVIKDDNGHAVGRGAFAILKGNRDFALVRLAKATLASPQMCHFGGPTGMDHTYAQTPALLEHYGNGLAISAVLPARTAVAQDTRSPDVVYAEGTAVFGDSGSGVTLNGRALGVLVSVFAGGEGIAGNMITRLPPQLELASKALKIKLSLVTAKRL